jgi:hypothetical protein
VEVKNEQAVKELRALLNLIYQIQRKCKAEGLWLSAGADPYKEHTDEAQQGPLVTKLLEMTKKLRKELNKK